MKKAVLLGLLLSILASRIYLFNPITQLLGDFGDKYEFFIFQYLIKENIANLKYPLARSDALRYPVGFELGHGFDGVLSTFSGALLGFVLPQTLAYNFTIILILWLNFLFSYLLFRYISKANLTSIALSFMYAFSPYVLARIMAGHTNLAFVGGFPLFLFFCWRFYKKMTASSQLVFWDFMSLGVGLLVISFGSLQYLIILAEFILLFVVTLAFLYPNKIYRAFLTFLHLLKLCLSPSNLKKVIPAIFIFTSIGLFFFGQYALGIFSGSFVYDFDMSNYYRCCVPKLTDLFIPNGYIGDIFKLFNHSPQSVERVISVGIVGGILLIWLLIKEKRPMVRNNLILSLLLFAILSLGFIRLPFWPEGGRSIVLITLGYLVVLSQNSLVRNRTFLWLIIVLHILERLPLNLHLTPPFPQKEAQIIRGMPGIAVLDIPISKYNPYRSALPYLYKKKIVGGYFHDTAETLSASSFLRGKFIERYICDEEKPSPDEWAYHPNDYAETLNLLRSLEIRTIVIHKDTKYEKFYYDSCKNVRYWWYSFAPEVMTISEATNGIQNKTLKIVKNPRLQTNIFFARSGKFILNGLFLVPNTLTDTLIQLPDRKTISNHWEKDGNGIKTTLSAPIEMTVKAGDTIDIVSNIKVKETLYVTVYYLFSPDGSNQAVKPVIEKVYTGSDIDIYEIH